MLAFALDTLLIVVYANKANQHTKVSASSLQSRRTARWRSSTGSASVCADALPDAALQQLMARVTGNYKRGNERTAADHPRNRLS